MRLYSRQRQRLPYLLRKTSAKRIQRPCNKTPRYYQDVGQKKKRHAHSIYGDGWFSRNSALEMQIRASLAGICREFCSEISIGRSLELFDRIVRILSFVFITLILHGQVSSVKCQQPCFKPAQMHNSSRPRRFALSLFDFNRTVAAANVGGNIKL